MSKLLIVDDEVDVREFAANFFSKRKINTITASNAKEALAILKKDKIDLVLLDIKMSGMDGIETLGLIREFDKEIKVIMVTGRKPDEEDSFSRCKELGVLDYIHKPLELDELERIVLNSIYPGKK